MFELLIFFTFFSCCPGKKAVFREDNLIVYLVPPSVEKVLASKIDTTDKKIFFYLSANKNEYLIYFAHYDENESYSGWIKNTSRKLFISGSFYPILFQSDEMFATTESSKDILKKFSSAKYPTIDKVSILFEGFYVKFDEKGEIIQTP